MKLLSICSLLIMISAGTGWCQTITLGVEGNIGFYSMTSLKDMQHVSANYPIPYKSAQNFPATPGFRVQALVKLNRLMNVGVFSGSTNTGARLTYSDVTGHKYRDVIASAFNLGLSNRIEVYHTELWSFYARVAAGAAFNKIGFKSRIYLVDDNVNLVESSQWKSTNYFVDVGVEAGYTWKNVYMKAFATHETSMADDATFVSGSATYPENRTFEAEWDGMRIGFGVEYQIKRFK
jgi:hypothetical protein